MMNLVTLDISQGKFPTRFSLLRSQTFIKGRIHCHSLGSSSMITLIRSLESSVNMESSDNTCKLKIFAKRHDKDVEKSVLVL